MVHKSLFITNPVLELIKSGRLSGILLIGGTILSILLSNSSRGEEYLNFWLIQAGPGFLNMSLLHWVNDGLMAVFFLLVGMEIKREVVQGELSDPKQAILPVIAALGGMIIPALIYSAINAGSPQNLSGWAIPTATDIAFSLGVLSLAGKRVPVSMKIFLMALAIIDDLGAIVIIALFYSSSLKPLMLLLGLFLLLLLLLANKRGVKNLAFYLVPGLLLWFLILKSGIHGTIAGILLALTIPVERIGHLEHRLNKPVNYFILPLFALANTALLLSFSNMESLVSSLGMGVILGLFVGKPLGIFLFPYVVVKLKMGKLPEAMRWKEILGVGLLAGIGFTMSIFIASLSFSDPGNLVIAKLAILGGSFLSALAGILFLYSFYPGKPRSA